ncbi:pyrroloquinoline quinone biosynthesis peptide chaperone PqqD [Streptomyces camelliae]|uniref:Pyrroloquinoline quinone biosynthesis peptide chaperone PqqD n=1 Tax=Streptomyces camelliae TaxID=3004093 RepID=A0ABY7NXP7_9ACTN|nr:pyrroloquinoline quinone biosynthesis peptide chaperone PqqD [Streptomyces sp. HUAS 2-6]WBO62986.1 pyrroloquinoline quinone biosynthesis peptide chaperone PqqD [Streptomyces sp. HUAS 2-6]
MPSNDPVRTVGDADRPRLAPHVRLMFDPTRERHVLLAPEAVTVLNGTGAAVLGLCDGERTVAGIVAELSGRYDRVAGDEVRFFLARLAARRCVEVGDG